MRRFIFILTFVAGSFGFCFPAIPVLEREVSLSFNNERLGNVLNKIQEQAGLVFSYSSSIISDLAPVSIHIRQKTVREALALLLPGKITFKAKNNYIILKEKTVEKNPKKTELKGYVYDKSTDKKIAHATIYDKASLQSVTTDDYGFYSISVPSKNQSIAINKENYKDTVVPLASLRSNDLTSINLDPVRDSLHNKDSVTFKSRLRELGNYTNQFVKRFDSYINTINIQDTIARNFQVSLLPFVGTNHKLSGNVYNKVSFNIFGGYARGVDGFEVGGFFNIDKENVHGAQLAGFFNLVGDTVKGTQMAGFFNITGKKMDGFQGAGFFNMNLGEAEGINAAGFVNSNFRKTRGMQLAGFVNVAADSMKGTQLAGYVNYAKNLKGVQGSGFINYAWSANGAQITGFVNHASKALQGIQIAGFLNSADSTNGYQVAGFSNCSRYIRGMQIAGFLNIAKQVNGTQLGFINISDSCTRIPIGFFSFVKKGVHQLELSGDEIFPANIAFRTGVPAFYNIFTAGVKPGNSNALWSFGYGLGTSFKIKNKLRSDVTLTANHISKGTFKDGESELYKLYWGVEYKFKNKISLAAGPVFNIYLADTDADDYLQKYNGIAPYTLFDHAFDNGFNIKGWVGGKISIRFF